MTNESILLLLQVSCWESPIWSVLFLALYHQSLLATLHMKMYVLKFIMIVF